MPSSTTAVPTLHDRFTERFPLSRTLHARARQVLPNGVTHDSRFLQPFPVYVKECRGARKLTVEGHDLVDLWMGHGSLLLGHGRPEVLEAAGKQLEKGTHLSACHELEVEWGELVCSMVPSAERVRFTNSGTEACMMAMRVARAATGKSKLIKFLGHFHGWGDHTEHSVEPPFGEPMSPGILPGITESVICLPANDLGLVYQTMESDDDIAAVILEPTGGGFGCVPVLPDFLKGLRELTQRRAIVLIFDEVITGFRVAPGGYQEVLGLKPDLTLLAKVLAGGFPGGALAGAAELLKVLEFGPAGRTGKMHHPGTFNANPVSAAAGIAALKIIRTGDDIRIANERAQCLRDGLNGVLNARGIPGLCYGQFSDFNINLYPESAGLGPDLQSIVRLSPEKLRSGAPSPMPQDFRLAMFLSGADISGLKGMTSSAHQPGDIEDVINSFEAALTLLGEVGYFD